MMSRVNAPAGDDRIGWRGLTDLPHPFTPPLDPLNRGVRIILNDGSGATTLDTTIPPGVFDEGTRRGWSVNVTGRVWTYKQIGNGVPLIDGIRKVVIRDFSSRTPGRVKFSVTGRQGSFPVGSLPVRGTMVFDTPIASTGQCAEATFPGPPGTAPACISPVAGLVICR